MPTFMSSLLFWLLFVSFFVRSILQLVTNTLSNSTASDSIPVTPYGRPLLYQYHFLSGSNCDPDNALLYESQWFFVVTGGCELLVSAQGPITKLEVMKADTQKTRSGSSYNCTITRPSVFPVSDNQLGYIHRRLGSQAKYSVLKLQDWDKVTNLNVVDTPGIIFDMIPLNRSCHFHMKKKIIRCMHLDNINMVIRYTDYERGDHGQIRANHNGIWPIPPAVNLKRQEVLAYYDVFTKTDHIWMEHNLQWLYNVDLEDQILRGNKSARLTTYHLSNHIRSHPQVVPVYSDAAGLVTAHCLNEKVGCRYMYNRVDAKSAMESTCLLELPYLTTVGVVTPLRTIVSDTVSTPTVLSPEAQKQVQTETESRSRTSALIPIYILVFFTFMLSLLVLVFHFLPAENTDLTDFYKQLEEQIEQWIEEYNQYVHAELEKPQKYDELKSK